MPTDNKLLFGLIGAGGFAREIMPLVFESQPRLDNTNVFFVETDLTHSHPSQSTIITEKEFMLKDGDKAFSVAIADSHFRQEISDKLIRAHIRPISLKSKYSCTHQDAQIDNGAIICPFSTVTANVQIGRFFHLNIYSYVAHDCIVGNFVTFAPRVSCNGNVHIKDHAYIGTGAVIKQGTRESPIVIGEGAFVGMGSIVTKSVPAHTTVFGNPARVIRKNLRSD